MAKSHCNCTPADAATWNSKTSGYAILSPLAHRGAHGATLICKAGNNHVITAAELAQIPLFAALDESARHTLAQKAADIRVEGGDWVIREGEDPRFFVVLEGLLQVVKDIVGQRRELEQLNRGRILWRDSHSPGHGQYRLRTGSVSKPPGPFRSPAATGTDSRFVLMRHGHFSDHDGSALHGGAVCKGHSLLARSCGWGRNTTRIAGVSAVSFPPIACNTTGWRGNLCQSARLPAFRQDTRESRWW